MIATPGDLVGGMFTKAPRGIILINELSLPPEDLLQTGIRTITHPALRVDPSFKTTCYPMGRPALLAAQAADAQEALYCDEDGYIMKASSATAALSKMARSSCQPPAPGHHLEEIKLLAAERNLPIQAQALKADDFIHATGCLLAGPRHPAD